MADTEATPTSPTSSTQSPRRGSDFQRQFLGRKPPLLRVHGQDRWPVRIVKQAATIATDLSYLVGNLVTLPAVAAIKGYRSLTHSHSRCGPLEILDQRTLPQHLAGVAVYSVALPYDVLKVALYLLEGSAEGVGVCAMGASQLLQQMTYRCCDSDLDASVRGPNQTDNNNGIELLEIPPVG